MLAELPSLLPSSKGTKKKTATRLHVPLLAVAFVPEKCTALDICAVMILYISGLSPPKTTTNPSPRPKPVRFACNLGYAWENVPRYSPDRTRLGVEVSDPASGGSLPYFLQQKKKKMINKTRKNKTETTDPTLIKHVNTVVYFIMAFKGHSREITANNRHTRIPTFYTRYCIDL